jgi:hypothetical protein
MTLHFSAPVSPASSVSSYEHGHQQPRHSWLLTDLDAKHPWKPKPEPSGKHQSRSNDSGPSVGSVEVECRAKFKELNAENLKLLCGALEKEVPWQKEIVPEIASTVLQCRSGIAKRRDKSRSTDAKEETWMLFLGGDARGKEAVARELAGLVFGSRSHLLTIRLGAAASPSGSEDCSNKRPRTSSPAGGKLACLERLYEAVSENPHRVILVEDVDQADRDCELGIKEAIESGVVRNRTGDDVVGLGDTIVILSCENFEGSRSRACSPPPSKQMKLETMEDATEEQTSDRKPDEAGSSCFDLNINVETYQVDKVHVDDVCLLAAVDRTLFFKRHEGEHS